MIAISIFQTGICLAQTSNTVITMPDFPTISGGRTMPSVSFPSMDGKFYQPKQSSKSTISTQHPPRAAEPSVNSLNVLNSQPITSTATIEDLSLQQKSLVSTASSSTVSAQELSMLNSLGMLSNISKLLVNSDTTKSGQDNNNSLLTSILTELQDIKNVQDKNLQALKKISIEQPGLSTKTSPYILRFNINGHDILPSCKTVYFSDIEQNGSFLLTGDRRYGYAQNSNTETFYLLFTPNGIENDKQTYQVTPAVSQMIEDSQSSLYKLSQQDILIAHKTGNLVTVHTKNKEYQIDLLLDIGKK